MKTFKQEAKGTARPPTSPKAEDVEVSRSNKKKN